ncbi:kappa-casein isoform X2 [Acomys russatus]|uniref:kappa-casein isoform X2 n=1 Tax=Acomys russatus TaxID=60746 RepID=UPI0021E2715E|nr:kappa-casein isoform X2 [Acomys russatus]
MMRNFIVAVNILALTLPLLCHGKEGLVYDQKRVLYTPAHYALRSSLHYEPNYSYYRPSVPFHAHTYPAIIMVLHLRSPFPISKWQQGPNFPQPIGARRFIPNPSFLAIPTNENQGSTANPVIRTIVPTESTPAPIIEPMMNTVASPEASTLSIDIPETSTVPISSPAA